LTGSDAKQIARRISHGRTWRSFATEQRRLVTHARCLHLGLNQLTCPILVINGTNDPTAAPQVVAALVRQLPNAEIITSDGGHLIPIDDPDAVTAAILRALRRDYRNSVSARPANGSIQNGSLHAYADDDSGEIVSGRFARDPARRRQAVRVGRDKR
jgi:hypothetical protein